MFLLLFQQRAEQSPLLRESSVRYGKDYAKQFRE